MLAARSITWMPPDAGALTGGFALSSNGRFLHPA
jgi:hypothetical protein